MNATFRPARRLLYVGVLLLAPSLALAAILPLHLAGNAFRGADPAVMWCFGLLGTAGSWVAGALVASYFLARMTIGQTTVSIHRIFRQWRFDVSSVQSMAWRPTQLRFKLVTSTAVFDLGVCTPTDQLQIIRIVRRFIPDERQEGWDEFCCRVALPLRDGRKPLRGNQRAVDFAIVPESQRVFVTRGYYDRFFAILGLVTLVVATAVWQLLNQPRAFAVLAGVAAFWIIIRSSIPKRGIWRARWLATKEDRFIGFAVLMMAVFSAVFRVLRIAEVPGQIEWAYLILTGLPLLAWVVFHAMRLEKVGAARFKDDVELSAEKWEAGEQALAL